MQILTMSCNVVSATDCPILSDAYPNSMGNWPTRIEKELWLKKNCIKAEHNIYD